MQTAKRRKVLRRVDAPEVVLGGRQASERPPRVDSSSTEAGRLHLADGADHGGIPGAEGLHKHSSAGPQQFVHGGGHSSLN